ncbi:MAG: Ca2+-dependent phosphoinositide-specific phospholipase C [Pirellulales bacterium]
MKHLSIATPSLLSTLVATLALSWASATVPAAEPAEVDGLRLNQLQTIGTHNSYHVRDPARPAKGRYAEWNYSHPPLEVQLDRGVRSFELDLHYRQGQFEVFHVPALDEGTTCPKLSDALAAVRRWSEAHPRHVPISFLFELKKEGPRLDKRIKDIDAEGFEKLDAQLRAGFAAGRIITPDEVRGSAATLRDAVTAGGWPTLAQCRGKVLFILHDDDRQRALYTAGHDSLRGRVMFVRSDPARDDAATLVMDNPRDPEIGPLAKAGYLIRTRADSGLNTAPSGQPARRDAAFASGAHILSTDYPAGEAAAQTGYVVEFPAAAPARVNPVNGPDALRGKAVAE